MVVHSSSTDFSDGNPPPSAPNSATARRRATPALAWAALRRPAISLIFDSDNAVLFDAPGPPIPSSASTACCAPTSILAVQMVSRAARFHRFGGVRFSTLPDSPREAFGIPFDRSPGRRTGNPPDQQGDDVIELVVRQNLAGNIVVGSARSITWPMSRRTFSRLC